MLKIFCLISYKYISVYRGLCTSLSPPPISEHLCSYLFIYHPSRLPSNHDFLTRKNNLCYMTVHNVVSPGLVMVRPTWSRFWVCWGLPFMIAGWYIRMMLTKILGGGVKIEWLVMLSCEYRSEGNDWQLDPKLYSTVCQWLLLLATSSTSFMVRLLSDILGS